MAYLPQKYIERRPLSQIRHEYCPQRDGAHGLPSQNRRYALNTRLNLKEMPPIIIQPRKAER